MGEQGARLLYPQYDASKREDTLKLFAILISTTFIFGCTTQEEHRVYRTQYVDPHAEGHSYAPGEESSPRVRETVHSTTTIKKPFSTQTSSYHVTRREAVQNRDNSYAQNTKEYAQTVDSEPEEQTTAYNARTVEPVNMSFTEPLSQRKVREIQTAVRDRGYDVGVDGVLGTQSLNALALFQQENGIKAHGQVDSFTLERLGVAFPRGHFR